MPAFEARSRYDVVWLRHTAAETGVWPGAVVVKGPLTHECPQMRLAKGNDPVEAFTAQRANQPLAECICFRRASRCSQRLDAERSERSINLIREDRVAIVYEMLPSMLRGYALAK